MAARERRPLNDNDVIVYVATLIFIIMIVAINALAGCTCSPAY